MKGFIQDNEEMVCVSHANRMWGKGKKALHLVSEACHFTSVDTLGRHRAQWKTCNKYDQVLNYEEAPPGM